jgi:two-component system, chemotaxis family, CheB/CheR fusion protein
LNFQLNILRYSLDSDELEAARQTLDETESALMTLIQITRELSVDLSPPILHNEGLIEAIRWLAKQMEQQHGLVVEVDAEGNIPLPDENLRVLLFQTVRELLFNVVKHAGVNASSVTLTSTDDHVHIEVSDQGRGFDVAQPSQNSQGLLRIGQRLQLLGGHIEIASTPGQGTRVTIHSPLHKPREGEA